MEMESGSELQIWGGIECTINRVGNKYFDQLEFSGHYYRPGDIGLIAELGIKVLRYPILWEKHLPCRDAVPDWSFTARNLAALQAHSITPIAGLVHHGSGPAYISFFNGSFEEGLADYA